jgi:predicted P-loop ATPase
MPTYQTIATRIDSGVFGGNPLQDKNEEQDVAGASSQSQQPSDSVNSVAAANAIPEKNGVGGPPNVFPHKPIGNGQQLPGTIGNLEALLAQHNVTVNFNVVTKDVEIHVPGQTGTAQNRGNVAMAYITSMASAAGMSVGNLSDYILAVADKNVRNPVADWITGKPWDGTRRLDALYKTVTAAPDFLPNFKDRLIRKWLISAVAAVFMGSGFRTRGALTFQGAQGLGKTTWVQSLVDDPILQSEVVKLGHAWDGGSKDARLTALRHWIVELGELEGSFRKEVASLKAFLTLDQDKIRPPYARTDFTYARKTVFFASVNQHQFLKDDTGNSRFWTIPVVKLDYSHGIDMQQLFAEVKLAFDKGEQWWLTQQEEDFLASTNLEHRDLGGTGELVRAALDLDRCKAENLPRMNAVQVLAELGIRYPSNVQSKECNAVLREFLGEPTRSKGYSWWRVPLREGNTQPDPADWHKY